MTNRVKYGMDISFIIIIIIIIVIGVSIRLLSELLFSHHDLSINVGKICVTLQAPLVSFCEYSHEHSGSITRNSFLAARL